MCVCNMYIVCTRLYHHHPVAHARDGADLLHKVPKVLLLLISVVTHAIKGCDPAGALVGARDTELECCHIQIMI